MQSNSEQKQVLNEIKTQLQTDFLLLKKLKVRKFYNTGRIIATAKIGVRKIRVTGSRFNIMDKFIAEYQDRYYTAI